MSTFTLNTAAMQLVTEMGHSISETWLVTQFERYLNDARKHLLNYYDWPFRETTDTTVSTVAGTATYSLTTNACEIRELRIGGSYDISLVETTLPEISRQSFDLELSGQPTHWYPNGYNASTQKVGFGLWPVPSAVLSIIPYITIMPIDLTSDSVIDVPESFYACLRDGARYYMEMDQGRPQNAAAMLRMFEGSLRTLRHKYTTRQAEQNMGVYQDVKTVRNQNRFFTGRYPKVW